MATVGASCDAVVAVVPSKNKSNENPALVPLCMCVPFTFLPRPASLYVFFCVHCLVVEHSMHGCKRRVQPLSSHHRFHCLHCTLFIYTHVWPQCVQCCACQNSRAQFGAGLHSKAYGSMRLRTNRCLNARDAMHCDSHASPLHTLRGMRKSNRTCRYPTSALILLLMHPSFSQSLSPNMKGRP